MKVKKKKPYIKKNAGNVPANNAFFNAGMGMMETLNQQKPLSEKQIKQIVKDCYTPYIAKLIEDNKELIDNNQFTEIYKSKLLDALVTSYFTELMIAAGIDPLFYLKKVPANYLYSSKHIKAIQIPSNITAIGINAFAYSDISVIFMPKSVKLFTSGCFRAMNRSIDIYYDGTTEDFGKIFGASGDTKYFFTGTDATIHCTDRVFSIKR